MKKILLSALVVMTIAGLASAATIATWDISGVATLDESVTEVLVGDFSVVDINAVSSPTGYRMSGFNTGTPVMSFSIDVSDGYQLTGATLAGSAGGSNTGPGFLGWYVNGTKVADLTRSGTTTAAFSAELGDLTGANTVSLQLLGTTAASSGSTLGTTGALFLNNVELTGTVTQQAVIPEPATMALLGIGGLALAIRRKLRK